MCQAFIIISTICFQVDSAYNFVFCHLLLSIQMTDTVGGGYGFPGIPEDLFNYMPSSSLHWQLKQWQYIVLIHI